MKKEEMLVAAIKNGTVIDHIPSSKLFQVVRLLHLLSVVAPNVSLCIIKDFEVVEKKCVTLPEDIKGIVKCANPKCITNNEPMPTLFHVKDREAGVIRCHYCEKEQNLEHVKLVNS